MLLIIAWFFSETGQLQAQQTLSEEELAALLERVEITTIDEREMALVPLHEILAIAMERSLTLKASQLGEEKARSAVTGATARNNPSLQLSYGYSKTPSLSSSSTCTGYACGTSTTSNSINSTYTQRLDNGMSYGLTYTDTVSQSTKLDRLEKGGAISSGTTYDPSAKSSLRSFVSIPFFQDSGTEINNIPVRLAEIAVERSHWSTRSTKLTLLKQTASTYWDLVGILESIAVQKKAVALSEKLLRDNQARFKAGILSSTEVKVTEIQLLRDKQNLLSWKQEAMKVEDQVRAALNLGALPIGLYPSDTPKVHPLDTEDLNTMLKKIYANDTQIALNEASLKQNKFELDQQLNKQETDLDLDLVYTLNGYSTSAFGGTGDFGQGDLHGFSTTLTWTVPLGDTATAEKIRQKRFQNRQLHLQIEERKSELRVTLQSLIRLLTLLKQELKTAQAVIRLSAEQLHNEIERSKLGKSTSFQVSQFQQEVVRSRQQEIMTRVRFEKTFLELQALTNEIYEFYHLPRD